MTKAKKRAGPPPGAKPAPPAPPTRRTKPKSALIIGSGPVVIGQAAEFDYAGTQACRALRGEGVRTILVNSNPATIMTDAEVADAVYLEPLTVEALESVSGATGNIVYETGVLRMRDEVATGQRLQQSMENTGLFPNMVIQMIAVGEESGSLDEMSAKVADFYEEDVDNAVDNLSSLLEPMIMAILGVLVGGLVIAMYLPIFSLYDKIR